MARKDKNSALVYRHLLKLDYINTWEEYTDNREINEVLSCASKANTGEEGIPDFLYVNEDLKLLIIIEVKPRISLHHAPPGKEDAQKYAICGIKHYLSFFTEKRLSESPNAA